jgi:outer membrane protein assembly factor BamB
VLWKVAVPGRGHASPVVVGDRVLVSTADEATRERALLCYHRQTGALVWKATLHTGAFVARHAKGSQASPTPACDGRRVYVPYAAEDALWLAAVDLDGRIAWQPRLGPFFSEHGYASSPVLYKNLVIVAGDHRAAPEGQPGEDASYLIGIDRETGAEVWRASRTSVPSYATPVVARLAGRDQLLLGGAGRVTSYDPATGKELWFCTWSGERAASSVTYGGDCVFASVTWRQAEIVCIRADGTGDVTASHRLWRQRRGAADVPSPLYADGRLYVINEQGMATCLDAATGNVVWQARLGGAFTASPVRAGGAILATDEEGTTHVFEAGASFRRLATNVLNDSVLASPALSGDRLLLRGRQFLWCLHGQAVAEPVVAQSRVDPAPRVRIPPPAPGTPALPAASPPGQGGSDEWLIGAGLVVVAFLVVAAGWFLVARRRPGPQPPSTPEWDDLEVIPEWDDLEVIDEPEPLVSFVCSACRKKLRVRAGLAGKKVKCPGCCKVVLARTPLAPS